MTTSNESTNGFKMASEDGHPRLDYVHEGKQYAPLVCLDDEDDPIAFIYVRNNNEVLLTVYIDGHGDPTGLTYNECVARAMGGVEVLTN